MTFESQLTASDNSSQAAQFCSQVPLVPHEQMTAYADTQRSHKDSSYPLPQLSLSDAKQCEAAYTSDNWPKVDAHGKPPKGYDRYDNSSDGSFTLYKDGEQWNYDKDGKPVQHTKESADLKTYTTTYPDGTKETLDRTTGNEHTQYASGDEKVVNRKTGVGYTRQESNGHEHHWGPKPADNYDIYHYNYPDHRVTEKTDSQHNVQSTETDYNDGSKSFQSADGTGHTQDKYGNENHWGPKPSDNYVSRKEADGTVFKVYKDGSTEYDYADGGKHVQSADGKSGYSMNASGDGVHWGPKPEDNYQIVCVDGQHSKRNYADGHSEVVPHM